MINPTTSVSGTTTRAEADTGLAPRPDGLKRDAFLRLLVTQLKHQDPTAPLDGEKILTQLAQFSSLEKLTEIATSMKQLEQSLLGAQASNQPTGQASNQPTGGR